MFCFAKTQCSVSQRHNVLFRKNTMSVSQRHNVLFREDTMFCFAKTQCSVCRKHNVLFTIYSVAYHPGTIRVPSGHPDGRRIVLRFASKLRSKGPIEFVSNRSILMIEFSLPRNGFKRTSCDGLAQQGPD